MGAPASVSDATKLAMISPMDTLGGRAAIESKGAGTGAFWNGEVIRLADQFVVIPTLATQSAGKTLPLRIEIRHFKGFGLNPQGTLAAWTALGSDALRDDAVVLDDTVAPIGSTYQGFTCTAGAVTASKQWTKTAAATWTAWY